MLPPGVEPDTPAATAAWDAWLCTHFVFDEETGEIVSIRDVVSAYAPSTTASAPASSCAPEAPTHQASEVPASASEAPVAPTVAATAPAPTIDPAAATARPRFVLPPHIKPNTPAAVDFNRAWSDANFVVDPQTWTVIPRSTPLPLAAPSTSAPAHVPSPAPEAPAAVPAAPTPPEAPAAPPKFVLPPHIKPGGPAALAAETAWFHTHYTVDPETRKPVLRPYPQPAATPSTNPSTIPPTPRHGWGIQGSNLDRHSPSAPAGLHSSSHNQVPDALPQRTPSPSYTAFQAAALDPLDEYLDHLGEREAAREAYEEAHPPAPFPSAPRAQTPSLEEIVERARENGTINTDQYALGCVDEYERRKARKEKENGKKAEGKSSEEGKENKEQQEHDFDYLYDDSTESLEFYVAKAKKKGEMETDWLARYCVDELAKRKAEEDKGKQVEGKGEENKKQQREYLEFSGDNSTESLEAYLAKAKKKGVAETDWLAIHCVHELAKRRGEVDEEQTEGQNEENAQEHNSQDNAQENTQENTQDNAHDNAQENTEEEPNPNWIITTGLIAHGWD
ncbi:MAG: hypothetical protein Q9174_004181 [Haloplaca sp. 1 TL-2023]